MYRPQPQPIEPRLWPRVRKEQGGCWVWTGAIKDNGYGVINWNGRKWRTHRVTYVLVVGPIPDGMDLDHLCRNRACCNPAHLEPVPRRVNLGRGLKGVLRTHCRLGHELTPENTLTVNRSNGHRDRICRTCKRAKDRVAYERRMGRSVA